MSISWMPSNNERVLFCVRNLHKSCHPMFVVLDLPGSMVDDYCLGEVDARNSIKRVLAWRSTLHNRRIVLPKDLTCTLLHRRSA